MRKCGNTETEEVTVFGVRGPDHSIAELVYQIRADLPAMAMAPARCELIDLMMSSPESSDLDSPAGSESDECHCH